MQFFFGILFCFLLHFIQLKKSRWFESSLRIINVQEKIKRTFWRRTSLCRDLPYQIIKTYNKVIIIKTVSVRHRINKIGQWNRIENPHIVLIVHGRLIFTMGRRTSNQWKIEFILNILKIFLFILKEKRTSTLHQYESKFDLG